MAAKAKSRNEAIPGLPRWTQGRRQSHLCCQAELTRPWLLGPEMERHRAVQRSLKAFKERGERQVGNRSKKTK